MNTKIRSLQAQIAGLDTYTQLAVLGSWQFVVNSACINQAMRYIPDANDEPGIDGYTPYEQARRAALTEAERSQLPGLLCLQRDIESMIHDCDGQSRGLNNTLEYMSSNVPSRDRFANEYEQRRRSNLRPAMSKKQFVDHEMARALEQHSKMVAKGDDAVRLCETITPAYMESSDIPDWVAETFENKLIDKLHGRWEKLEYIRTNPRRNKNIRDSAEADQLLIAQVLAEYGEKPGFEGDQAATYDDAESVDPFNDSLEKVA